MRSAVLIALCVLPGLALAQAGGDPDCDHDKDSAQRVMEPALAAAIIAGGVQGDPVGPLSGDLNDIFRAAGLTVDPTPEPALFAVRPSILPGSRVDDLSMADVSGNRHDDLIIVRNGGKERTLQIFEGSPTGIAETPTHTKVIAADEDALTAALDLYIDLELEAGLELGPENVETLEPAAAESGSAATDLAGQQAALLEVAAETDDADLALALQLDTEYADEMPKLSRSQMMQGHSGPTTRELAAFYEEIYAREGETIGSMAFSDVDGDGMRDTLITVKDGDEVRLYLGGTPELAWSAGLDDPNRESLFGGLLSTGDLNNDGAVDVVLSNNAAAGGEAWVFYGTSRPELTFRRRSSPDA